MGPKVTAAIEFAEIAGRPAAIGCLEDAAEVVAGTPGNLDQGRRSRPHLTTPPAIDRRQCALPCLI
jgi:hypothetical protein